MHFKFILQNRNVDCENYLDDLGGAEIPDLAWEAFKKMGALLDILGIIVNSVKMTLELDSTRLLVLLPLVHVKAEPFSKNTKLPQGNVRKR